jgi:hypothetical protein
MVRGIPTKEAPGVIEIIPNDRVVATFPTGAIAQAWLNEYSQQVSWDDLKTWLRACPRL